MDGVGSPLKNPPGQLTQLTTSCTYQEMDKTTSQTPVQPSQSSGQEFTPGHQGAYLAGGNDVSVLFCTNINKELDYEDLYLVFKQFGTIERMKLRLSSDKNSFVCFVLYNSNESARKAYKSMNGHMLNECTVEAKICSKERFIKEHHDFIPEDLGYSNETKVDRNPPLPIWFVATYKEGRENIIGAAKCIQRKVGKLPYDNLKRYGRNLLIKASD